MADKKSLTPEEKKLAAEKHVDELVQKGLVALEEMRKLTQEQVDYTLSLRWLFPHTACVLTHNSGPHALLSAF